MATFTFLPKNSSSFSLATKASTAWTNLVKRARSFILKEDAFYLLMETGDRIVIEPDSSVETWVNQTKN